MTSAALLLLADGRFPAGGHAHSGGVEAACATGGITDVGSLRAFVRGRLHTAGSVDATFAACACAGQHPWTDLDHACDVRIVSSRLREASRSLGRQALRAGQRVWPHPSLGELRVALPAGPHQPIVLGAIAGAAGLTPLDAALCALHHLATAAATAAVRLLGLDPYDVHAMLASLADDIELLATDAVVRSRGPLDELPASSGPLVDVLADDHATWEVRLFAS
jgi:urease accessory protein